MAVAEVIETVVDSIPCAEQIHTNTQQKYYQNMKVEVEVQEQEEERKEWQKEEGGGGAGGTVGENEYQ